jgi:hypothetical protein
MYLDHFMRRSDRVEYCTLRLIAIAGVLVAVKLNEDRLLSVSQCVKECNNDYTPDMIIKTERLLLVYLNFKMNYPTSIDFVQFFLYLSDPKFEFNEIINESLSFIYVSLMGKYDQEFPTTST